MNHDYETVLENIASNVKRIRKAQKKSQESLAYDSDIDRTYIGYIENKKHNVSIGKLCAIAKALNVDVEDLLRKPPELEEHP